ncbi:uncharacterized protein F4807DRAFT_425425 [Annulohypoxylon truncatum]|uniref:uncharacterized protein n=1 Tax=Annulohypoxylon truncatum TaxID=327061 RepID=UPI002008B8B1|nr:uncharacterized protein F4807DRAFT_425425 [Annulohypoxylon truncatum]KAI1210028.1 hypothetical protein F4807DRAFT_425425 [Annulohypoxylon truncatum]
MESLRRQGRDRFLHRVENLSPECKVLEISSSGNDAIYSERMMPMDQVQNYIRTDSEQSIFRLVQFTVSVFVQPRPKEYGELAWVLDVLMELGIETYLIDSHICATGCDMMERELCRKGKVINMIAETGYIFMAGSYNQTTRSTTCFFFVWTTGSDSKRQLKYTAEFMKANARLYQDKHFLPFLLVRLFTDHIFWLFPKYYSEDFGRFDEENLQLWDNNCTNLRLIQRDSYCINDITSYMRAYIDGSTEQGNSSTSSQDILDGDLDIREAFRMMELRLPSIQRRIEFERQRSDEFLSRIPRRLMREDTMASIELAKAGVELTRAAKGDSSSMKVIAVMTMVFLPGTFIAALFAVPSLNWNGDDVVGENFWMYWAFTIPFTILVLVLWLVITQRKQMRSAFETSKKQWYAKADALIRRLHREGSTVGREEQEREEV